MSVQFSGGEPTLVARISWTRFRYARKSGITTAFKPATNGIEFAKSFEFAQQAVEAGMRFTPYTCNSMASATPLNDHRAVGNLFDVEAESDRQSAQSGMRNRAGW